MHKIDGKLDRKAKYCNFSLGVDNNEKDNISRIGVCDTFGFDNPDSSKGRNLVSMLKNQSI